MVSEAADEVKPNAAVVKKFQRFRRTVDKGGHSRLVDVAATEKPQIGGHLVAGVAVALCLRQMVLANPDEPVGIDRAAAQSARLFEHHRPQAEFAGSKGRGEAGNSGSENDDVPGFVRDHRATP